MGSPAPSVPIEELLAHRLWVRAVARRLVSDPSRADDLEQEAWLSAIEHPPRHDGGLRGWFRALLRSRARDAWRGEGRREAHESAAPPRRPVPSPEEVVAAAEAHRRVVEAVMGLEEPYRATVLLRFFEDLPPQAVAERMGVPVETVRTRVKRALEQLRERLDREHGGDRKAWVAVLLPLAGGDLARPGPAPAPPPIPAWPAATSLAAAGLGILAVAGITAAVLDWGQGPAPPRGRDPAVPRADGRGGPPRPEPRPAPAPAEADPAGVPAGSTRGPEPSPSAIGDGVPVRVRDLADGAPVEDLALSVTRDEGGTLEVRTDRGGFALLPQEGWKKVLPGDEAWRSPTYAPGEILQARELWLYRTVAIAGEVRAESDERAINPASVRLAVVLFDRHGPLGGQTRETAPWGPRWMREHGIADSMDLPRADVDGTFFARVPRIRGARITASAPGWIGDEAPLPPEPPGEEPARVDLVLRDAPRVCGILADENGEPVPGIRVLLFLSFRVPAAEASGPAQRLRPSGGYTIRTTGDEAVVCLVDARPSGKDGSFEFATAAKGDVLLVVQADGCRPLSRSLGRIEESSVRCELRLSRLDEARRVRLLRGGAVLASIRITFIDLSAGDPQPSLDLATDERGEVPAEALEAGHRYFVIGPWEMKGDGSNIVEWKGEPGDVELGKPGEAREGR